MTQNTPPQTARIFIRDCRVDLHIGLNHGEHGAPQQVVISVDADYAPDASFPDIRENSRARIIDYSAIYTFITRDLPAMGHIFLLESAAQQILDFCFSDPHVRTAGVRIEKTAIFTNAAGAGVEMRRTRSGDAS